MSPWRWTACRLTLSWEETATCGRHASMRDWLRVSTNGAGLAGRPDVEVAIDPAELEGLDEEGVRALYDERLAQQQSTASREVTSPLPITFPQLLSCSLGHARAVVCCTAVP